MLSTILHSPYAHLLAGLFLVYVAPAILHAALNPSPTSTWGGLLARAVKLGFDPAAFEDEEKRLLKTLAEKAASSVTVLAILVAAAMGAIGVASCKPGEAKSVESGVINGAALVCILAAPLEATDEAVAELCGLDAMLVADLKRGRAAARARLAAPAGSK